MSTLWAWILSFLTMYAAAPNAMDREVPKCAAAVSVAYASIHDAPPAK